MNAIVWRFVIFEFSAPCIESNLLRAVLRGAEDIKRAERSSNDQRSDARWTCFWNADSQMVKHDVF